MADPETAQKDVEADAADVDNEQDFEVEGEDDNVAMLKAPSESAPISEDSVFYIPMQDQNFGHVGQMDELTNQLMKNPEVLAALQTRLGMMATPAGYIASLPKVVKRRIKALKKLQLEATKIEAKFYEEVHAIECKYAELYLPLHEKRRLITTGTYEPTEEESEWPSDDEKEEDENLSEELKTKAKIEEGKTDNKEIKENKENKDDANTVGIPDFWLMLFKNVDMLAEMVQEHDEPILKHLKDIKVQFSQSNPMGFTLEFFFEPNDYFTNTVLTKDYVMKCAPDETDPFSFEGPEIIKCKGCSVDWKKGKNVTVKTIKKKQKHKAHGAVRTVTKTVQNDSFFNFFNPPSVPDDEAEVDEETQALLAADFEIGHFIRERIVPRAVLYFTGEALEDDDYDEEEGEEEADDDNEADDDDDENDADFNPQADKSGKKGANPSECKQQ